MCVCACMCCRNLTGKSACCVLRASMLYAFGRTYGLPYKMATFIAKRGYSIQSRKNEKSHIIWAGQVSTEQNVLALKPTSITHLVLPPWSHPTTGGLCLISCVIWFQEESSLVFERAPVGYKMDWKVRGLKQGFGQNLVKFKNWVSKLCTYNTFTWQKNQGT